MQHGGGPGLLLLLVLSQLAHWTSAAPRIDVAPCSACKAIAAELQDRIDNEPVRNHLDMRHRLDATGKRYGKVIDYRVSELRAVELLEDLCSGMKRWTLVSTTHNSEAGATEGQVHRTWHWERTSQADKASRPSKDEEDMRQKQLGSYCGRVLEEYDDDITEAIQSGKLEAQGVASWLCGELMQACPPSKGAVEAAADTSTGDTTAAAEAARDEL